MSGNRDRRNGIPFAPFCALKAPCERGGAYLRACAMVFYHPTEGGRLSARARDAVCRSPRVEDLENFSLIKQSSFAIDEDAIDASATRER